MLLLSLAALTAAPSPAPDAPGWIAFEQRQRGWAASPTEYDPASLSRRGTRLQVRYRYTFHLSGLPDPTFLVHTEIDCTRRRARALEILRYDGMVMPGRRGPGRERVPTIATPIAAGSEEAALADRLCMPPAPAAR